MDILSIYGLCRCFCNNFGCRGFSYPDSTNCKQRQSYFSPVSLKVSLANGVLLIPPFSRALYFLKSLPVAYLVLSSLTHCELIFKYVKDKIRELFFFPLDNHWNQCHSSKRLPFATEWSWQPCPVCWTILGSFFWLCFFALQPCVIVVMSECHSVLP